MDRARELAERGRYTAAPNPLVGAVISEDEHVVAEGWHVRPGEHHAEVMALQRAGSSARGATMHVTLEPCNHHVRSPGPPCVEAMLRAGIRRVVVGHLDPNPRMRGRSVAMLRDAGVEVEVLDAPAFARQNEQWFHFMDTGRPFVHLKLAATLDGRIAAAGGDSKWVTGEAARRRAHELRAEAGAVLVGAGTVRADDPTLTARGLPVAPPAITRVVLDPRLTTTEDSRLARTTGDSPVLVFAEPDTLENRELEEAGVEVVRTPLAVEEGLDLGFILEELGRRGVRGVLVEGGGETAARFVRAGLVDKMTLFYAPKLLGAEGVPMIGKLRVARMAEASGYGVVDVGKVGEDVVVTLYPRRVDEERNVYRAG